MKNYTLLFTLILMFASFESFSQQIDQLHEQPKVAFIEFEEMKFDFGGITEGELVSHVFKFTNTGEVPLTILNAKGSCGCTVPYFPKAPIMPGETSEIEVEFNSKGKERNQSKRITITSNTEPANTYLTITGEVIKNSTVIDNDKSNYLKKANKEKIESIKPNCYAIYPNPTSEIIRIELKEHIGKSAIIKIHNELGREVLSKEVKEISRESTSFDVRSFSGGVYIVSISIDGEKPKSQCFVVAR